MPTSINMYINVRVEVPNTDVRILKTDTNYDFWPAEWDSLLYGQHTPGQYEFAD
jgi:hypothetical protein